MTRLKRIQGRNAWTTTEPELLPAQRQSGSYYPKRCRACKRPCHWAGPLCVACQAKARKEAAT